MDENDRYRGGDREADPDERPGAPALRRMKLEQEQAGDREDEASEGEDVDEQAPSAARIAALVEIVEVGNPAAAGDFARCLAGREIDCDPRVAAGARRGEIEDRKSTRLNSSH